MWRLKIFERYDNIKDFKYYFGWGLITSVTVFSLFLVYYLVLPPKVSATTPTKSESADLKSPVKIIFNKPVNRSAISIEIEPKIEGETHFEKGILSSHLYREIDFVPDTYFDPNQDYKITVHNISSTLGKRQSVSFNLDFKTKSIPVIISTKPLSNQEDFNPADPVEINLDQNNDKIVDFNFRFDPLVEFDESLTNNNKTYILKPKAPLPQGQKYTLIAERSIINNENDNIANQSKPEEVLNLQFKIKDPPMLASMTPSGNNVHIDTKEIVLNFKDSMNEDEVLENTSILPDIAGSWNWSNDKKLIYKISGALNYETKYSIKINKGVHNKNNGFLENDLFTSFTTIGHVKVSEVSPKNNASDIAVNANISITFDQEIDHASAQGVFSLSPSVNGQFSWGDNKMTFNPDNDFGRDAKYSISISPGIKSVFGLDSNQSFSASFSTVTSVITLNVKLDYQDKPLSCEAAALKMALSYRGVSVSEDDIMNIVGYDPTVHNGNVWGDPYTAFVGNIYGKQDTTGYGVYWDPIARAANNWRSSQAFSGWSASTLANAIANNNPVLIWGVVGGSYHDPWITPGGKQINAWKGEHARTAIGFRGSVENPTEFIINDPYVGRITWSVSQLNSNWSTFGNSGVVVY